MAQAIERAFIEIAADFSDFDDDVKQGVVHAMRQAAREITRQTSGMTEDFRKLGLSAARSLRAYALNIEKGRPASETLIRAIQNLEQEFMRLERRGVKAPEAIARAFFQLRDHLVTGPRKALQGLTRESERFGDQIRAALGRASLGGVQKLNESLEDLEQTIRIELVRATNKLEDEFQQLGALPQFERLEDQLRDLRLRGMEALEDSAKEAKAELVELFRKGELSAEDFRRELGRISNHLTGNLEAALKDVNTDLRRLGGIAEKSTDQARHGFRQMGNAAVAASHRADRSIGSVIARLNRLRFVALDLRFIMAGIGLFAAKRFVDFGVEATSQIEQATLSLQTLAKQIEGVASDPFESFRGSAEEALAEVITFARETPFAITDAVDAVRRIGAFLPSFHIADPDELDTIGERTEIALDIFNDLGGALAVLGQQDALPNLVKALGDVGAAGKLTGEEVRQLRNALPGVNIREAIITGIYDPTIRASESIQFLRKEFAELGADATTAPTEATAAFVDLQRRGLISTEAVVQGLRSTLRNLAGDEALQRFTLTIAGTMEKVREALQLGLYDGMQQLGELAVQELLPALDDLEDASSKFGGAITALAEEALPIAVEGFIDLLEIADVVIEDMTDFAAENEPEIRRAFETMAEVADLFSEALGEVFEALLPLGNILGDVLVVALEALLPLLEITSAAIEAIAVVIDALPDEMILAAFAAKQLATAYKGLAVFAGLAGTSVKGLTAAMVLNRSALAGGALAAGVIGLGLAIQYFRDKAEEGRDAANDFLAELDFSNLDSGAFKDLNKAADEIGDITERMIEVSSEGTNAALFGFLTNPVGAVQAAGEAARLAAEYEVIAGAIDQALRDTGQFHRNFLDVRDDLFELGDGFDAVQVAALLTRDNVLAMAQALDIPFDVITGDTAEFRKELIEAVDKAGGLGAALAIIGEEIPELDLTRITNQADDMAQAFDNATSALVNMVDQQKAITDPAFGLLNAQQDLAEAIEKFKELDAEAKAGAEGLKFSIQAQEAVIDIIGSIGALAANAGGEVGAGLDDVVEIIRNRSGLIEDVGSDMADILIAQLEDFMQNFPDIAQAIGLDSENVAQIVKEGISGGIQRGFSLGGYKTGLDKFDRQIEDVLQSYADSQATGVDRLFVEIRQAFDDGLPGLIRKGEQVARTLLESILGEMQGYQFRFDSTFRSLLTVPNVSDIPSPSPNPSSTPLPSNLPEADRRLASAVTVNQTITSTDPILAASESVRKLNNDLFLAGGV